MSRKREKKMKELREAKDRKMKKVAAGLSLVLVIVLAFEVPKVLHKGGSSAVPPAATTTDTTATATPSTGVTPTTAPGTAAAGVTPVASSKLPTNSDAQPKVGKSQLYSFSHFGGKDPFVQQVQDLSAGLPDGDPGSTATSVGTTAAVTHPHHQTRTLAVTGAARISVNGRVQVVRPGTRFPSANPLFRLVSVSGGVARIGIATGSYSSGAQTVSLVAGRTLTLVDTADGIRYRLRLLA